MRLRTAKNPGRFAHREALATRRPFGTSAIPAAVGLALRPVLRQRTRTMVSRLVPALSCTLALGASFGLAFVACASSTVHIPDVSTSDSGTNPNPDAGKGKAKDAAPDDTDPAPLADSGSHP